MAWWGAGVGASIGMLFGGPIGAIIGAGIGSSMTKDQSELGSGQQKEIGFLVAAFTMLGKIAKADGVVSPDEVAFVDSFIERQLELDGRSRKVAIEIFNRARLDNTSIYKYAQQFSDIFRYDEAMRETIYRVLFMTALADGHLHPAEEEILRQIPMYLQIEESAYRRLAAELLGNGASGPSTGNLKQDYKILGCSPDASDAEVKSAFRGKCREYHPDKLASKGLPEGFTKFANEQMQQFTDAYDKIMKSRR